MRSYQQIRCQRCRAVNPLGEELCGACGTRLMLVVEPSALRFEEDALADGAQDALVVERLSLMENHLTRVINHLERSTDLLSHQAQLVSREHMLLESLIRMLSAAGVIEIGELQRLWQANCARATEDAQQSKRRELQRAEIVQAYAGSAAQEFAQLVQAGCAALDGAGGDKGLRLLERAAALAPENAPLNALLGRQFFRLGRTRLAHDYLERAYAAAPADACVCLLLALARGDEGDKAGACALLAETERLSDGTASYALHYARGRMQAHEGRWREALASFKRALAAHPAAEAHYVVALAALQVGYTKLAVSHANRALALDQHYTEAYILLGVIQRKAGEEARARQAFAQARAQSVPTGAKGGGPGRQPAARYTNESLLRSFFGVGATRERMLTGGDERLAALLRTQALGG